ncbi:MAG TPA: tripartite tricarboxylate transporter TctB family protein, partial [Candidatus Binatia bacterium]|nr:tripartite tricarboxylate transporter TctB family protein [Candidatus Binatia bacterium]
TQQFGDIYAMLALGLLGWLMKQLGWPRAPFLVGFVLTKPTEQYLWLSISRYDFEWLLHPGVIALGVLLIASIVWVVQGRRKGKTLGAEESGEGEVLLGKIPAVLFTSAVLIVVVAALYDAQDFPYLGAIFPMAATIPAVFMAAGQLVLEMRSDIPSPPPENRKRSKLALGYLFSLVLYLLLILLIGFGVATAAFTFAFLFGWIRWQWVKALTYTVAVVGIAQLMSWLLNLYWPEGMLLSLW